MRVITKILNADQKTYRAGEVLDISESEAKKLISEGLAFSQVSSELEEIQVITKVDIEEVEEDGEDSI